MERKDRIVRAFEVENLKLQLIEPTVSSIREAKYNYSKKFTEYLKQGFYTRRKLESLLDTENSGYVKNHLERREELLKAISEVNKLIESEKDPEKLEALAGIMSLYRNYLLQEDTSMNSIFSNTVETMAEEDRLNYLTTTMIKKEDGIFLWNSLEDLLQESNYGLVESCKYQVSCWEYNLDPAWEDSLPESIAILRAKKLREDLETTSKETIKSEPIKKQTRGRKRKSITHTDE
jgi:hypothetical protein